MGQKVNPIGMRVTVNHDWRSRWFASKKEFGLWINEDAAIREFIKKRLEMAGVSRITIERSGNRLRVGIAAARPGIIVGRKGQDIEKIKSELASMTGGKEIYLDLHEIRDPDVDAQLVAESIALQLVRRISFKRAMKRAITTAMEKGVNGIKVKITGRLGGAELARTEWYKEGSIPLQTLCSNIDYGFAEARTTAGKIGIKVWICKKAEESNKEKF